MHLLFLGDPKKSEVFDYWAQSLIGTFVVHGYSLETQKQELTLEKWKLVKNKLAKSNQKNPKTMQKKTNPPVTDNRLWLNPAELIFSFASQTLIQITALQEP